MGQQVGTPDQWLMGDVFLKNVILQLGCDTDVSGLQRVRL